MCLAVGTRKLPVIFFKRITVGFAALETVIQCNVQQSLLRIDQILERLVDTVAVDIVRIFFMKNGSEVAAEVLWVKAQHGADVFQTEFFPVMFFYDGKNLVDPGDLRV